MRACRVRAKECVALGQCVSTWWNYHGKDLQKATFRSHFTSNLNFTFYSEFFIAMKRPSKAGKAGIKKGKKTKTAMKNERKLGQAEALHGKLWKQWTQHILSVGPSWLYVAVTLTHMLCARISEVLALQAKDFNFRHRHVRIKPLKRQPEVGNWEKTLLAVGEEG